MNQNQNGGQSMALPLVVEAGPDRGAASPSGLARYLASAADLIGGELARHGALLFRGFGVDDTEAFAKALAGVGVPLLDYVDGNSPRTKKQKGIYTSTEYPSEHFISLHNELSYCRQWPARLFFCCVIAPTNGGNTLIADSRRVLGALDPDIVARFESRRVRYVRNLHDGHGFGPSWQQTFETTDKAVVEAFCDRAGMTYHWLADNVIRVSQTGPGVIVHPVTGQRVWFNQADQFHPSNHPPEYREALLEMVDGDVCALPTYASYGDGSPIDDRDLEQVRACFRGQTVYFPWQRGDFLMVDNVLTAHGRAPFSGPRKILVAMS